MNANVREPKSINAELEREVKSSPDEMSYRDSRAANDFHAPSRIGSRRTAAEFSRRFPLRRVEIIMVHRAPEESRLSPTTETKRNVSLKGQGGADQLLE